MGLGQFFLVRAISRGTVHLGFDRYQSESKSIQQEIVQSFRIKREIEKRFKNKKIPIMDTFFARSGEAMGSWFAVKGMLILGLSSLSAAWGALPLAVLLSWVGYQTTKSKKV